MIYERLRIMRDLLADDGSIYVHCDWRINGAIRLVMDEVFGSKNLISEIVWYYTNKYGANSSAFDSFHNLLFFYSKGSGFTYNSVKVPVKEERKQPFRKWNKELGKNEWQKDESGNRIYVESKEKELADVWEIPVINPMAHERLGYDTQKPEQLLNTIISSSSNVGDLVADFFCGSGTTLAVAEKLGRRWIGCDLGRFAIHTSRKRLIGVQREARKQGKPYRSFEILNLGKYERQYFIGVDPNLPEPERREQSTRREEHYLNLILSAYKAERVFQSPPFHGKKGRTMVVVGPIDAPVTHAQFLEIVAECRRKKIGAVDLLGFEFEMGLAPNLTDEARHKGVNVALRYIPKDVFDKRAVDAGQVQFYDLAYVEVRPQVQGLSARVTLADFSVYYRQEDLDTLGTKLKPGGSKVTVANGQVVKLSKDKKGIITSDLLTKKWTDWVDYWAVDFDYESAPETIIEVVNGLELRKTTGNFLFENEWQSFRTRKDRSLELTSAFHQYPAKGKYKVAVKVIDIFGNDTTKVVGVTI